MNSYRIMLVDDDVSFLEYTSRILEKNFGEPVLSISDSRNVMDSLKDGGICTILLDLNMPHIKGLDLLTDINYRFPEIPVLIVTASEDSETVVSAIRQGAFDFVTKASGKSRLIAAVSKALKHYYTVKELDTLKQDYFFPDDSGTTRFVSNSPKISRVFKYMKNIAPTPTPVLITGETGVGKELIAELVYELSGLKGKMVKVNVAGLDDNMFSDTLFGHVKGAFTGAENVRDGLVKSSENGLLFLDEIGDLEQSSQVKLLRLLQDNTYYPIGSDIAKKVKTKIVAATNRDLKEMSETGEFRKDLFYRLTFHTVSVPPLRDRKEDIFPIAEHILNKVAESYGQTKTVITASALMMLTGYDYPGNVRELEGILYDLAAEANGKQIDEKTVIEQFRKKGIKLSGKFEEFENSERLKITHSGDFPSIRDVTDYMIKMALEEADGNISKAAAMLGINRQTIYRHLSE
jgi:DNA-binding NtrC family response regulator